MEDIIVIGAGAAGCFAAAVAAGLKPGRKILILEKTRQPLAKVKISGGGRCNVTHGRFDIPFLIENYPRGKEFLRAAFHQFQPEDMIAWLAKRGVNVKTEKDGRVFPETNTSQTIIDCLLSELKKFEVRIALEKEVVRLCPSKDGWDVVLKDETVLQAKKVIFATGGLTRSYSVLEELGHKLIKPIPSLFTFELQETWLKSLSGSVVPLAKLSLEGAPFSSQGPLLITHVGISGPATLRLSAFGARFFFEKDYKATLFLNWTGLETLLAVKEAIYAQKNNHPEKRVLMSPLFGLSKNLWKALLEQIVPTSLDKNWARIARAEIDLLSSALYKMPLHTTGKNTNKEEFVTCGGVALEEIHPKTMESRKVPGLYFAGEILNIDGVTGGFNFQNAWTGGFLAANAVQAALG